VSAQPAQRLEKILARVAREQGLDQERLRRWVSFLALCGVLEQAVERDVIDTYFLKGGVAMELRFARAARTTKDFDLGLVGNRAERIRKLEEVLKLQFDAFTFRLKPETHHMQLADTTRAFPELLPGSIVRVNAKLRETAHSDFSEADRNDIQQIVEWTREYADSLDPLSDLPAAIEEFVRPESKYWWLE
jgi:Nucleotidyl transferase AbiEii toxin, Type IV TA system